MIINKENSQGERVTCQKKVILDYLRLVKTHPSAEAIYNATRKKLPQISLGTIYRNLKNLKEKGEILEIPSEMAHYDGDLSPHSHFICEECRKIFDISEKYYVFQTKKIKVGKINNYQVYFYGKCKSCG